MTDERGLITSATDPSVAASMAVFTRLQTVKSVLAPDLTDQELQLFAMVCEAGHWNPFNREIYAIKRQGRVTFQTGIDGYRSKAEDTHEYERSDEPTYEPADWDTGKVGDHPKTASVTVYRRRHGQLIPQSATARWDSYNVDGAQGFQWRKMPEVMLSKCAEALAFRKLFPRTFEGVYVDAEMDQAQTVEGQAVEVAATAESRMAARRAKAAPVVVSEPEAAPEPSQPATDADGVILEGETREVTVQSQAAERVAEHRAARVAEQDAIAQVVPTAVVPRPDPHAMTFGESHPCKLHAIPRVPDGRNGWECAECRPPR